MLRAPPAYNRTEVCVWRTAGADSQHNYYVNVWQATANERIAIDFRLTERWTAGLNWTWSRKHRSWELTAGAESVQFQIRSSEKRVQDSRWLLFSVQWLVAEMWFSVQRSTFHSSTDPLFKSRVPSYPHCYITTLSDVHRSVMRKRVAMETHQHLFLFHSTMPQLSNTTPIVLSAFELLSLGLFHSETTTCTFHMYSQHAVVCSGPVWRLRSFDRG